MSLILAGSIIVIQLFKIKEIASRCIIGVIFETEMPTPHFPKLIEINIIYTFFFVGRGRIFHPSSSFAETKCYTPVCTLLLCPWQIFGQAPSFNFTSSDIYDVRSTPSSIRARRFTYNYKFLCNFNKMNSMRYQATRVFQYTDEQSNMTSLMKIGIRQ